MDKSENGKLNLFKSLFKGREDVFAMHWTKGEKSGYMPAYYYEPYIYSLYKTKGGTFKEFPDKSYLQITDLQLAQHLNGEQLIGIYPLLQNNTSWFIASDFDKKDWEKESRTFINVCKVHNIPAYLERSRSGQGGHVWIFFEQPYPAEKSRKIHISMLEQAGIFSVFDKKSNFDKLFPNQGIHSGNGLGNLIALPLYKPAMEAGNSCFINEQSEPYKDQWDFLSSIRKVSVTELDDVYSTCLSGNDKFVPKNDSGKLHIKLNNKIRINRSGMTPELISILKNELNFANSEYFIKKNSDNSTWGTERYFRFIEEVEHEVMLPRGYIGRLILHCRELHIDFEFQDERERYKPVNFTANINLRPQQKAVLKAISDKDFGVISAPPGSGKTIIGLQIIAEKQQPALIIVHCKQLMEQWIEHIETFLGIPKNKISKIDSSYVNDPSDKNSYVKAPSAKQRKTKPSRSITVAMIQSLGEYLNQQVTDGFAKSFGTIIIDECHHIPAQTYRDTISKFSSYYEYGLTATPFRKGNDGKIIFIHLGEVIADIRPQKNT